MAISCHVSMTGFQGAGNVWAVSLGDFAGISGQATGGPLGPYTGFLSNGPAASSSGPELVYFTGADDVDIAMSWTEQRYLHPILGELRGAIGDITVTANDGTITFTPGLDSGTGLYVPPALWVTGSTQIGGKPDRGLAGCHDDLGEDFGNTTMTCSQCGTSGGEKFSLLDFISDKRIFYTAGTAKTEAFVSCDASNRWLLPPFGPRYDTDKVGFVYPQGWWPFLEGASNEDGSMGSLSVHGYPGSHYIAYAPYNVGAPPAEYGSPAEIMQWLTPSGIAGFVPFGPNVPNVGGSSAVYLFGLGDAYGFNISGPAQYTLLSTVSKEAIPIHSTVTKWPSGTPVAGAPLSVYDASFPGDKSDNRLSPFQTTTGHGTIFKAAPVLTDSMGRGPTTTLVATGISNPALSPGVGDCFPSGVVGQDIRGENNATYPISPPPASTKTYLYRNNLDPRGPYSGSYPFDVDDPPFSNTGPGLSSAPIIELWTSPTLLTVTRATSLAIDNGSAPTLWQTVGNGSFSADTHVTIAAGTGGVAFTRSGGSLNAGIGRLLTGGSATLRRGMRQFRYIRVRMTSTVKGAIRLKFYSNINNNTANPGGPSLNFTVNLAVGDNELTFDMQSLAPVIDTTTGNPAQPIAGTGDMADYCGNWSLWNSDPDVADPFSSYLTANPIIGTIPGGSGGGAIPWQNADIWWLRFDNLADGETYTLEEITCIDRTDGKRTPLRVLGSAQPAGVPAPYGGEGLRYVLQVLVNGRPVAGFPAVFNELLTLSTSSIVVIDDLVARWNDTIDGGSGVWSITVDDPTLTALLPPAWLEVVPGSLTESGFHLRARAVYSNAFAGVVKSCGVHPGWTAIVGYQIKALWEWGGVFAGIALNGDTRRPIVGTVAAEYTYLPTATTMQRNISVCDDDGFWMISQRQPWYTNMPTGKTFDLLSNDGGLTAYTFAAIDRNVTYVTIVTHPSIPSVPALLAPLDGSLHKVERYFYKLSGASVVGKDGLAYWGNSAGAPRSWDSFAWAIGPVIITESLIADNPCIALRHDGRLFVAWDEQTQDNPRQADAWVSYSDDDGRTWSTPTMLVAGGQFPKVPVGHDASTYFVTYKDDGSNQGIGTLVGQYSNPGDISPSAPFTLLKVDDAGNLVPIVAQLGKFDLRHLAEGASRWILTVCEPGATSSTEYVSAHDGGGTFRRQGTATAGMDIGPGGNMAYTAKAFESMSNVPLTGVQAVDGVTTGDNDTAYLGAQTDPTENGPWITSSSTAWARPAWFPSGKTIQPGEGLAFSAPGGAVNGSKLINETSTAPFVVDTDVQAWALTVASAAPVLVQKDVFAASIATATIGPLTKTPNGAQLDVFVDGRLQPDNQFTYPGTGGALFIDLAVALVLSEIESEVIVRYTY